MGSEYALDDLTRSWYNPCMTQPSIAQVRGVFLPEVQLPEDMEVMRKWGLEPHYTYDEAAIICMRSVNHIQRLVSKHNLRRVLVKKGQGAGHHVKVVLLPARTVLWIRDKCLGQFSFPEDVGQTIST